jgi:hypothetical protein
MATAPPHPQAAPTTLAQPTQPLDRAQQAHPTIMDAPVVPLVVQGVPQRRPTLAIMAARARPVDPMAMVVALSALLVALADVQLVLPAVALVAAPVVRRVVVALAAVAPLALVVDPAVALVAAPVVRRVVALAAVALVGAPAAAARARVAWPVPVAMVALVEDVDVVVAVVPAAADHVAQQQPRRASPDPSRCLRPCW